MKQEFGNTEYADANLYFVGEEGDTLLAVKSTETSKKLRALDLFAGAGGFSLAAQRSGIEVVAAVELNAHACATYKHNLVNDDFPKLYNDDILELDPSVVRSRHFNKSSECDIILGGPPCQGFSVHRIKNSGVDDPRFCTKSRLG